MSDPVEYGKWYHIKNHYVDAGGTYLDVNGPARDPGTLWMNCVSRK